MADIADLHIHSNYSDGLLSPEEIFKKAVDKKLTAISITDHDTSDSYDEVPAIAEKYSIDYIQGIEFSSYENGREHHILGYCLDLDNKNLRDHLEVFRLARLDRAKKISVKLKSLGIDAAMDLIIEKAGRAPIARPHIADVLVDLGYVKNYKDAFTEYLAIGKPAYQDKAYFPVEKCIELINKSGGVAVLAHPNNSIDQSTLYRFIKYGLDGIEVYHPSHNEQTRKFYHTIASQYWLLETGGSDYHGSRDYDEDNFGKIHVPYSVVESIRFHAGKK